MTDGHDPGKTIARGAAQRYDPLVDSLARGRSGVLTRIVCLGSLVAAGACGGTGRVVNPFDGTVTGGVESRIRVEVQNLNFNDATVWGLRGSQRIRIGRVPGKGDREFNVEWNIATAIAFEIDIVASRGCRTRAVPVESGSRVWVTIPSDMGFDCRAGRR